MPRKWVLRCVLLCASLMMGTIAWGQVSTATFYGTVQDSTGAVIPGATATLTHEATGTVVTREASDSGEFQFDFLRVGRYTLSIESAGFKRFQSTGIELAAAQNVRQSFTLELGDVTETVTVEGQAPMLNAVASDQRESLSEMQVKELPIARRNFANLLSVGTGIEASGGGGVRMNGLGRSGLRVTVDGGDATQNVENPGTSSYQSFNYIDVLSVEAIQEVQVTKGVIAAEYAFQLSGNVNLISKGGTNEWHGTAFENFQSDSLNARKQFLAFEPGLTFNQFGGSIGGPIKRDKVFIFGTFEGYEDRTSQLVAGDFPTQKLRNEVLAVQPQYQKFLFSLPIPNEPHSPDADVARYSSAGRETASERHAVVRADFTLNDNSTLNINYKRGRPERITPRASAVNSRLFDSKGERIAANYIAFGPSWSSESRFAYNYNWLERIDQFWDVSLDPDNPNESFFGGRRVPSFTVASLGFSNGDGAEFNSFFGPTWSIEEKFALHKGQHSLKFGGIFQKRGAGRINSENPRINYTNKADFLANIPDRFQFLFGNNRYHSRMSEFGFFIQDDWRVSQKLVVNLGVRYDSFGGYTAQPENPTEPAGFWNLDGLRDSRFTFGPFRSPFKPVEADRALNLGPRVGFAYNVDGEDTVIRGGFSTMFSIQTLDDYNSAVGRGPDSPVKNIFSKTEAALYGMKFPFYNEQAIAISQRLFREGGRTEVGSIFDPNMQNPYSMNFYLGVQRSLTSSTVLETAFVGTRGVKFRLQRQANEVDRVTGVRPNPNMGSSRYFEAVQNTSYASWQTSLRQRFARNFSGSAHYTWSKALSYTGGDSGANFSGDTVNSIQDFFQWWNDRGPSAGDVKHNFVTDFLYELPTFSGSNSVVRGVLGGWQLGGIFTAQSGQPLRITQPSSLTVARPDYIGGDVFTPNRGEDDLQYLNRAAFARVPVGAASGATLRPGNLGNGAVRLPGRWNLDFSLGKKFAVTERVGLQIRADMFNSLNRTNFNAVSTSITASSFGRFTNTTGARIIQLNARLSF